MRSSAPSDLPLASDLPTTREDVAAQRRLRAAQHDEPGRLDEDQLRRLWPPEIFGPWPARRTTAAGRRPFELEPELDAPVRPRSGVSRRPATDEDLAFLSRLYASTREEELRQVAWSPEEKESFLRQQFAAQDRHYREHYPGAQRDLILVGGEPAGRLYVARWANEIRIMDIALLPAHRGASIGTRLLRELLAEAERERKPITVHVEMFNRARRLYERLGFAIKEERGVYRLMEWRPSGLEPPSRSYDKLL